jgi:formiminotetrahydrofolate cyclodeaminase
MANTQEARHVTRLQAAQREYRAADAAAQAAYKAATDELTAYIEANMGRDDEEYIGELEAIEVRYGVPQAADREKTARLALIEEARRQATSDPAFAERSPSEQSEIAAIFDNAQRFANTNRKLLDICLRMA